MLSVLAASALLLGSMAGPATAEPTAEFQKEIRPLLEQYCTKCHSPNRKKGGVDLARFLDSGAVHSDPKTWEITLAQIRDRNMPPEDKPQPTPEERDRLAVWIESALDAVDESKLPKDPGRYVLHRLSRLEYNNTVRDLFGVNTRPADKFPPDGGGGGGFDNNAATLFIPPVLMERYIAAAGDVVNAAKPEVIFIARPDGGVSKREAARKIFAHHAPRIYRRPVEKDELKRLESVFNAAQKRGESFEDSVKLGLKSMLVSPHFLFRIEESQATVSAKSRKASDAGQAAAGSPTIHRVRDIELANRLSYFLWSSMPDGELFAQAAANKLGEPAVLEAQVRRMLLDPKARTFAENFAGQWLRVRELKTVTQPDNKKFPEFSISLRDAMYDETIEFFHGLLRENRSLLEVIDADYTYLNEKLAKHYGIEGVSGKAFQRVSLNDRQRGGVLGMASVLTVTSYPLRTSPVLRGRWVLEEILGTPPPPPPPLVKSLPPDDKPRDGLTFRQRLEQHRVQPDCAGCHKRMDPLGFGLENFDAIGRWRTKMADELVDASGEMTTGEKFTGPAELKQLLLKRTDDFTRNISEKMLAYALGRGLEYYDTPIVKQISKSVQRDEYRTATLVTEIVKSLPFQYRRSTELDEKGETAKDGKTTQASLK